jgi:hypothetical protein
MSELSLPWTTDAATPEGDQQASYTQAQLAILHKIVAACSNFEGVAPGFLNELEVDVAGANTVSVATGGAMVDGIVYHNDASQNVNIPGAVGSGNTRIDRIVLRADWAGFNVSVHRIAGVDAASPTAPAITQNSGTIYDIMLARVLVTTAGMVTVIDERTFATPKIDNSTLDVSSGGTLRVKAQGIATGNIANNAVTTAKIADGNVTTAKIANDAIDDTKVGNRVPQFYRRQGSNATDWTFAGDTGYVPSAVRMQAGARSSSTTGEVTVTFPVAFGAPPLVFTQLRDVFQGGVSTDIAIADIRNVTANGFAFAVYEPDGTRIARIVNWFAVGPE